MSAIDPIEDLRREHPGLAAWFFLPSDRIEHGFRPADGMLTSATLVSRRFYREQTGYASVSGPEVTLVLSRAPLTQTISDSSLVALLEGAARDRRPLVFVAPAFGDELVATIAINHERNVINAMALVADPSEVEYLGQTLAVPVSDGALSSGTIHVDEVLATARGSVLIAPGGVRLGLISVGGVDEKQMWHAWREMNAAVWPSRPPYR